jgi:WD40 repeat protein
MIPRVSWAASLITLLASLPVAPQEPKAAEIAVDAVGDPLPEGAVRRFGTLRLRHGSYLYAVAYSPDRKTLASAGADGLRVWEAVSGKERFSAPPPKEGDNGIYGYLSLAFAPDGKVLAAGGADGSIIVCDSTTGKELGHWTVCKGQIRGLGFTPDGKKLAAAGRDGVLRLWDIHKKEDVLSASKPHVPAAHSVFTSLANDGKTAVVAGTHPFSLIAYDTVSGKKVFELPSDPKKHNHLSAIAFAPDSKTLVVGGWDGNASGSYWVRFWDTVSGEEQARQRIDRRHMATALAFSFDGKTLAVAGPPIATKVHLYDWKTGKEIYSVPSITGGVDTIAFSPDGKVLALAGGFGNSIRLMDIGTGKEQVSHPGHLAGVASLAVAPDGKTLYSVGDKSVRAWNLTNGKELPPFPGHEHLGLSLTLSPDGKTLASGGGPSYMPAPAHAVLLWDVATRKELQQVTTRKVHEHLSATEPMQSLSFARDGKTLLVGGSNGYVHYLRLWDIATKKELRRWPPSQSPEHMAQVLFSPDGTSIVSSTNTVLTMWDAGSGEKVWSRPVNTYVGNCVTFTPDGQWLAVYDRDKHIYLLEAHTGQEALKLAVRDVWGGVVAFSADGRTLAAAGTRLDPAIRLFDLALEKEHAAFNGHRGGVTAMTFIPGGKRLASASHDTTILLWDLQRIPPLQAGKPLAAEEFDELWKDLGRNEASRAHRAVWRLATASPQSLTLLKKNLRPELFPSTKDMNRWLKGLGDESFAVRQKASEELAKQGIYARPYLTDGLANKPDIETRRRIEGLLAKSKTQPVPPELRQALRVIQVLERIGTKDALLIMESMAAAALPAVSLARQRLAERIKGASE